MKKIWIITATMLLWSMPSFAGGLEIFLNDISVHAGSNRDGFAADLSMHFGVPRSRVYTVLDTVSDPSDAFMVLQLSRMTRRPPEYIIRSYHHHPRWYDVAHDLGIRPGSREYVIIREGNFGYHPRYSEYGTIREYHREVPPRHKHSHRHRDYHDRYREHY